MPKLECVECGAEFKPHNARKPKRFCSVKCETKWNNRAAVRGRLLLHFFMTARYDRNHEDEARHICNNLARAFRDSDKIKRDGRQSWLSFEQARELVPLAFSTAGDGR